MRELLIRTISGAVLVAILLFCILFSPWTCAALGALIVIVGTYEMSRLQNTESLPHFLAVLLLSLGAYAVAGLVALEVIAARWLLLDCFVCVFLICVSEHTGSHDAVHVPTRIVWRNGRSKVAHLGVRLAVDQRHLRLFDGQAAGQTQAVCQGLTGKND